MKDSEAFRCEVPYPVSLVGAASTLRRFSEIAWLDGVVEGQPPSLSVIGFEPSLILEQPFDSTTATGLGLATLREWPCGTVQQRNPRGWEVLRNEVRARRASANLGGLGPGWIGYIGFEAAGELERLPVAHTDDFGLPVLRMALFERVVVLDHAQARAEAIMCAGRNVVRDVTWLERWRAASAATAPSVNFAPPHCAREINRAEYESHVRHALEYIAAGDIYQVNLCQRLRLSGLPDPLSAYAAIRNRSPAPYSALLAWDDSAILSVSPELFLRLDRNRALTRPIKGTRPRGDDVNSDAAHRAALLASEKDAAELAMIVDLHRNDLGRVCRYTTVRVDAARRLEAHPTVFHTLAEISAELAPQHDALDLLAASFPAGSISGVPKIRALQIIHELETCVRGAYTGAIGIFCCSGDMCFNVAIRTLQVRGRDGALHVGGGIVSGSNPTEEYDETLVKAAGILNALGIEVAR